MHLTLFLYIKFEGAPRAGLLLFYAFSNIAVAIYALHNNIPAYALRQSTEPLTAFSSLVCGIYPVKAKPAQNAF